MTTKREHEVKGFYGLIENNLSTGKILLSLFGKVVMNMIFLKLHRRVFDQVNLIKESGAKNLVRKGSTRAKMMNLLKQTEKVNILAKKVILTSLFYKQRNRLSFLIRILMEETKRKVEFRSPAALRFIGPGDR